MNNRVPIDILGHADCAGRFRRCDELGHPGFPAFATLIDSFREKNPEGIVLLDCGDQIWCKHWDGEPVVHSIAMCGTDAFIFGNHEFDEGLEHIERIPEWAGEKFPVVCANAIVKETGCPIRGTFPYVILEKAGIKIGVLGLTTEYTGKMVTGKYFEPFEMTSAVEAAHKYIPLMREAGAQIIVVVAHMPFYIAEDNSISGELYDLMTAIPKVDCIIGGHIPGDYANIVEDTVVLKGGFAYSSLATARLWFDLDTEKVEEKECAVYHPNPDGYINPKYVDFVEPIIVPHIARLETKIGETDEMWSIRLSSETRLGNFLADCMREASGTEIAYMNATSAGGTINPGNITIENIVNVVGFNDPLMTSKIKGWQLYQLFELVYEPERFGNNAGLFFSGMIAYVDHTKPAFQKVQLLTLTDGTPIEPQKSYTVTCSEYMSYGGNDTGLVAKKLKWNTLDQRYQDCVIERIMSDGKMNVTGEQRMFEIGRPENDNSPF